MSRFGELLAILARAEVRFVLVGGAAVLLHGHARVTADLDILAEASEENARRLRGALAAWGEGAGAELSVEELATPQMGALRVLEDFPLDVFTLMRARGVGRDVTYGDLIGGARRRTLSNGVTVCYADIEQLLALKAGTGRPKDESDARILTEIARGQREAAAVDLAGMEGGAAEEWGESGQGEWRRDEG